MIAYQPWLAPLGITYTQYLVLLVLWEQDAQPLNAISHQLYLESATYNTKKHFSDIPLRISDFLYHSPQEPQDSSLSRKGVLMISKGLNRMIFFLSDNRTIPPDHLFSFMTVYASIR